jgi:hypothetical protein
MPGCAMSNGIITDNGGRRSGIERRQFSYSEHIPERRSGEYRRSGIDRRVRYNENTGKTEQRSITDEPIQLVFFEKLYS